LSAPGQGGEQINPTMPFDAFNLDSFKPASAAAFREVVEGRKSGALG